MTVVVHTEGLGKEYRIRHELEPRYATLRDSLANLASVYRRNRTVTDERFWALRNVALEIKQGERIGVIGRNGAGKSTLLKLLSRITHPTEGRFSLRGRVASLLEVGTGFHPELSGRENIYLNGAILGMHRKEIDRKFDEIVDFSGVEKFLDTPVKRYSSGMSVRLAFAVAAHLEPEILVVDEVLAVGDLQFQKKCLGKMQDVSRQGRTVLFVSHNMSALENLCTEGVLLDQGMVAYRGEMTETINRYIDSTHEGNHCALDSRTDREGIGNIRLSEIVVSSDRKQGVDGFSAGTPLHFSLLLSSTISAEVRVIIGVYDFMNAGIVRFDSDLTGDELLVKEGETTVHCVTEAAPIMPGSYFINVAVIRQGEMEDYVARAAYLNFYPSDYFGSGRFFSESDSKLAKFMVRHKWSAGDTAS